MKSSPIALGCVLLLSLNVKVNSQAPVVANGSSNLRVILLGTAGGPTFNSQRLGIGTLVLAGPRDSCSTVVVG